MNYELRAFGFSGFLASENVILYQLDFTTDNQPRTTNIFKLSATRYLLKPET